ncbi:OpgC domain-containing protein [Jannaschia sp. S6380]|uniref:OpgC family protein n=1 Tax=Jannaschia sp. S6380 TaxID=2926408 RepID=UPI001FF4AD96|nr:OpgC domain-containing protein [Jannaschia sp. S6380]MCK0166735.1 OpgC domain-containing protein [Jannaschia sp. S6380]
MTTTTPDAAYAGRPVTMATAGAAIRDPRLDFFRGLAMFIILLAHTPGNAWTLWIPARWGFSDATEIFVFCSGMASAIAFGRTFDRAGWTMGAARVAYRVWQIYWAHICMFLALATILAAIDATGWHPDKEYIGSLNLWKFFADPAPQLIGLMTLTYVPNYFDILPMYMVVLVMMPLVVALARVSLPLLALASVTVWLFAQGALLEWLNLGHLHLSLPAEPWSDRQWFFNPFGWQLLFFTGFAFMRGWIPAPPVRPWLIGLAIAFVIVSFFLSSMGFRLFQTDAVKGVYTALTGCAETGFGACNPVFDWRQAHGGWFDKSDHGILHYAHFLALAYLAWALAGAGGHRLVATGQGALARLWDEFVAVVMKVGQQSLAVFVFSMVLARINGYLLDVIGRSAGTWALINLTGFGLLVACAYGAGWFKSQPWRVRR